MIYPLNANNQSAHSNGWSNSTRTINKRVASLPIEIQPMASVKWGCVTQVVQHRAVRWHDLVPMLISPDHIPQKNDVLVGRVVEIGRNGAIELATGRKAELHLGDILVGAFGNRYATNQYEGIVPEPSDFYHLLSQGGVIGKVVSASYTMSNPTIVEPLGFLNDGSNGVLNLASYGLVPLSQQRTPTILVLGSSMDAGKTTTASALVRGLSLAGWCVHAGKLTGTGCAKDINKMLDAGAQRVLDFTSCGYASTAGSSIEELEAISHRIIEHLSLGCPDILILEIADGVVQSETAQLSKLLTKQKMVDGAIVAIHDVLSVSLASSIVEEHFRLRVFGMSGAATISPLSTSELRGLTSHEVYDIVDLSDPKIALCMEKFLANINYNSSDEIISEVLTSVQR